ncbi:hypothetical protein SpCBS45565_g02436 [Spizellomyces sp. 'palustris']|nr:hypothetical protein SpCBS45565_g02436 [Spizellomyces sp. 'palustris']
MSRDTTRGLYFCMPHAGTLRLTNHIVTPARGKSFDTKSLLTLAFNHKEAAQHLNDSTLANAQVGAQAEDKPWLFIVAWMAMQYRMQDPEGSERPEIYKNVDKNRVAKSNGTVMWGEQARPDILIKLLNFQKG